jgi:hypothetical protein
MFSPADLKDATFLKATVLESAYLENNNGKFLTRALPFQAQFSPIYTMAVFDYNKDGNLDFVAAGNQSSIRIRMGVIDANFGQLYEGDGKGNFNYVPQARSGLRMTGDAKSLAIIEADKQVFLLVGTNNLGVSTYKIN